ncbi:hypothetical protein CGSMWGv0288E_03184 [Gardnerella vaginalis 0288E]|nr:hypothetical protein CGSMWGv0288E_03184 [Gardnerella vaginalis 0288E]
MFFTSKTFRSQKGAAQCIMGLGTHQEFVDRPTADSYISILAFCLQGRSLEELKTYISNNHFPWEYIEWLTSHNFLIKTTNTYTFLNARNYILKINFSLIVFSIVRSI